MTQDDLDIEWDAALRTGVPSPLLWQLMDQSDRPLSDFKGKYRTLFRMAAEQSQDAMTAKAVEFYRALPRKRGNQKARLEETARKFPTIFQNVLKRECLKPSGRLYRYFGETAEEFGGNAETLVGRTDVG